MAKRSAGLLLYRRRARGLEVLLVHPGGPFWAKKDLGAWTLPKGEIDPGEDPALCAQTAFLDRLAEVAAQSVSARRPATMCQMNSTITARSSAP